MEPKSQPQPTKRLKARKDGGLSMSKITAEIEFDDPVVLEIYETMAKLKGETIGQLAGKAMQQALTPIMDRSDGAFEEWVATKLEGKDELTSVGIN